MITHNPLKIKKPDLLNPAYTILIESLLNHYLFTIICAPKACEPVPPTKPLANTV